MKNETLLIALAATVLASSPVLAEQQWCKPGTTPAKAESELVSMLKEKGYDVRATGMEHGCFEAKAIGPDGKRVEVYVDPTTGEIVREKK